MNCTMCSAAVAAVESSIVNYQYLINRGAVEGTSKNMGGFFSDAEYDMTTFSTSTTEKTILSYSKKKNNFLALRMASFSTACSVICPVLLFSWLLLDKV